MKKVIFTIFCAAGILSLNAQQSLVKEAEKAMKKGVEYVEVLKMIEPAWTNSETKDDAAVYYIPGKAGFDSYDRGYLKMQLNQLDDEGQLAMAVALLGGYDNFLKALPLDTVVDAKGKVKTKYSKDILNTIRDNYNSFTQAGINFFNAKDYANAYRSWNIFEQLSENANHYGIKAQPDSVVANYIYNSGLAAWQMGDNALASKSFMRATQKGYDKEAAWQYGLATAIQGNLTDELVYFAKNGNERFGKTDNQYINSLINYYLKNEKYDDAIAYLEAAIANSPEESQYYALEGIIYDGKENAEKAKELYKKALSLNPKNGLANYYYGRSLSIEGSKMADEFQGNEDEYQKFYQSELLPRYKEAISVLETAYTEDPNNRQPTLRLLEQLYYLTNNEEGMNSVKERQLD